MRKSQGKPGDLPFVHDFGDWGLYDAGDGKYKLCANGKVEGNANYVLEVQNGKILSKNDRSRLMSGRPEVYEALEKFFETGESESLVSTEDDPYGDIALSRNRKLTALQNHKRLALYKRQNEIGRKLGHNEAFFQVLQDYYSGLYAPRSCEMLAEQLDRLEPEFKPVTIEDLI